MSAKRRMAANPSAEGFYLRLTSPMRAAYKAA